MPPRSKKSKPMMIRMDDQMSADIKAIAKANDLSASDVIRLAVRRQLPAIKSGRTTLQPS